MPPHPINRLERYWPSAPLRSYLVAVILLAILPLAALMSYQLFRDVTGQQARIEDSLTRSSAALSQAVESELIASLDALTALSHSAVLRQDGPAQLAGLLQGRPRPRRDWHSIFLLDGQGLLLFDTAAPAPGGPPAGLRDIHQKVMDRGQPAVSGLVGTSATPALSVTLAVPVTRDGGLHYVLGARVDNEVWQRLAGTASRPADGYAVIFDAQNRLISDTLGVKIPAGTLLPADAVDSMRGSSFGVQRTSAIDGRTVYAAWHSVPVAGWGVHVGVPASPIDAAHRRAVVAALSASGGSLLLGAILAALAARRITRPLHHLAVQGHAGLRGRVAVTEIAMLRDALRAAAQQDEAARHRLEAKAAEVEAAGTQLRENHRLMELAQEAGHAGFFHYRFAAQELVWTPGQCKLFGIDQLDEPGLQAWFRRIDADDRERVEREFWTACALRRDKETLEYRVSLPDGSSRWLSSRVLLHYQPDGSASQATGVTVDMTDHREAEMQRVHLTERALAARQEAEAASRAKDEFLTMLSHELRNPLGAISAAADVLEIAPPGSESSTEARGIIARQTRNLAHMMNDLLDVGRVVAGKILLARQPVNLATLADRVHRTLELTGESADHPLRLNAQPAWVDGDAVRIEQVMTNLVTNAIKYTPAGRRIDIAVRQQGASAVFEVKDSGIGIPASLLPHIFELFVQGERTLDRPAGGLGIGLTLVRRLVELHGGTVAAESSNSGSVFTVTLPAIQPPVRTGDDAVPPSRRRKVLVIDDNADVLAALRSKLELDGHTVSTAADGIEGLRRLLKLQPEVSLVDIGLPGLTGYELARHARAAGYAGRLIALSGYGAEQDVHNALVAGFDAYLVKPVDPHELRVSLSID